MLLYDVSTSTLALAPLNPLSAAFPRASSAPRASYRGIIAVKNTANGQIIGYISRNSSAHPQYHYKRSTADALVVSFSIDIDMSAVYYDVRILSEVSAHWLARPFTTPSLITNWTEL